jgi:glycosyltransferase involved in cell wall biosynthesis
VKIFIVNGSGQFKGGAEKVALSSALALARKGYSVTVLAAHGPVSPELEACENLNVLTAHPTEPEPLKNIGDRVRYLWPKRVGGLLHEQLRMAPVGDAVVHFHSGYLEFGVPGFRQLAASQVPIVYTHHDYAWACPLMGFYDYTKQASCPLTGGSLACLTTDCVNSHVDKLIRFTRHLGTHQTSGIGRHVAEHVFVSRTSQAKISPYLSPGARQTVLPNPADFTQNPPVTITDNSKFGWVGRLTTEKDPVMLAKVAKSICAPTLFIGDGPLLADVAAVNPCAEMTGWKSGEEVQSLLNRTRALVMTSRWLEAAPLVLAEAFCRGLPAIVPSETAAAEFVDHGRTGLIYESRNEDSLREALTRLMDSEVAANMGAEAYRRFWLNPPNWDAHLKGLDEIYSRALSDHKRSAA